jgi:PTH1 family peptidyl-tRNA hydrolase
MKLIIGLGNPDKKYASTRHNIGHIIAAKIDQAKITDTYMNESGVFVQKLVHFYKLDPSNLYIIHDDLDLPVGEYRLQFDRGPAGHHGVESIIQHLGTQKFWRFRVGIGHPKFEAVEDFVLKPFTSEEKVLISQTIDKILININEIINS